MPTIIGSAIDLHGITALLAILVGGTALGLWGIVFALPAAAIIDGPTRPFLVGPGPASCGLRSRLPQPAMAEDGKVRMNVVPSPSAVSTRISPPYFITSRRAMVRPKPVPWPGALVVKNGSKIFER